MKMDCIKVVIHLFKSLRAFWKHSQMLTKMEGLLLTSRVRFFSLLSIRHQVVLVFCFNSAWFKGKQTFLSNPLGQRVPYFFSRGDEPTLSCHNFNTLSRKWIVGKCRQTHELGIAEVTLIKYQILLASLQENI